MAGSWYLVIIVLVVAALFFLVALRERAMLKRARTERRYRMQYEPRGYKAYHNLPRGLTPPSQRDKPSRPPPSDAPPREDDAPTQSD